MIIKYDNIFHSKAPPNFAQIEIFGLKINHLATLHLVKIGQTILWPVFPSQPTPVVNPGCT
jgi:hypothetical protein